MGEIVLLTGRPEDEIVGRLDTKLVGPKGAKVEIPRPTLGNITTILEYDSRWTGRLEWSDFAGIATIRDETGARVDITDEMETEVALWLDAVYQIVIGTPKVGEAMRVVAARHRYHPVAEYLEGLRWDGRRRLERYLADYLGAEDTPLHQVVGVRWFISAVARVMQPGCKVDTVLILVGRQEAGKSGSFRRLCADEAWFSDSLIDFRSKDAYQTIQGLWIYELAELDTLRRSDNSAVKAFLSAQQDRYRRSYGRNVVTVPRQCVFVGSTNEAEFLSDPTGSRRFWPVRVADSIDLDGISRARDQLWAEAVQLYREGEQWWLTREESASLRAVSELYQQADSWEEIIREWLAGRMPGPGGGVTVRDVLVDALEIPAGQHKRGDQMRVAGILSRVGYHRVRAQREGRRMYLWVRQ